MVEAQRSADAFFWINHTYNHFNLDCYTGGPSGNCRPATYDESVFEVQRNFETGRQIGIPFDPMSVVSPGLSGLKNLDFLRAAADSGARYLISDFSTPDGSPSRPNTGMLTPLNPNLVFVPRLATNIFYNATTPAEGTDGSETDEYNYFFGSAGIVRIGGQAGPPSRLTRRIVKLSSVRATHCCSSCCAMSYIRACSIKATSLLTATDAFFLRT